MNTAEAKLSESLMFSQKKAAVTVIAAQLILLLFFGVFTKPYDELVNNQDAFAVGYGMYSGVLIMMFIGFGYLMTFLAEYGIGAVALTMLVTVIGMQWAIFTEAFFGSCWSGIWGYVSINILDFLNALYALAAVLISFGGVIGKVSAFQLVVMTLMELVFYSLNKQVFQLGYYYLEDVGGTIVIHMFGAYFGLAVAYVLGPPNAVGKQGYTSDIFSFIGTLFLWIYWPSFVGGALNPGVGGQQRAVVNTILALIGSSTMAFGVSSLLNGDFKFRPVDLQNATLAGGVSIGSVANLTLHPALPLFIGMCAGTISTFGFARLQSYLENRHLLHDTCGINNLHGMPSVFGGLVSVIIAASKTPSKHDQDQYDAMSSSEAQKQWLWQLCSIFTTVFFAIVFGVFTGRILKFVESRNFHKFKKFHDSEYLMVETEEESATTFEGEAVHNQILATQPIDEKL